MLCPKKASGRPASGRTAGKIASARSARLSMLGSARRSWRPGYCTAETSTDGDSAVETGKKKLAEPPACGKQTSWTALSGAW
jgi:hypothetical protein